MSVLAANCIYIKEEADKEENDIPEQFDFGTIEDTKRCSIVKREPNDERKNSGTSSYVRDEEEIKLGEIHKKEDYENIEVKEETLDLENITRNTISSEEYRHDLTMSSKRSSTSPCANNRKKQRKSIDLDEKVRIIRLHADGKSVNAIARDLQKSHSTITTILKNKEKILQAVKGSASMKATRLTKLREGPISEMEKLLNTWIEDQTQKRIALNTMTITAKAKSLFDMMKKKAGPDYDVQFSASSGWLKRFKNRYSLYNVKVSGESANADTNATEEFIQTLDKIIVDGGYLPQQIMNMDETSLFWKRMPERTFIHKEAKSMPGFKEYKDRVTILLGGSVSGYKLKPFVVWHTENPRVFKNIDKRMLPVYYRANKKSWMTESLFQDALLNCYAPEFEKYCLKEHIEFKILLLLGNGSGHPSFIGDLHPNIKVVFLPPNTTSLILPMNQGVIAAFKSYYLRRIFAQIISATEGGKKTLKDFWKDYNIYDCIKNIGWAWDDVTQQCVTGVWKHIMRRYVNNVKFFEKDAELGKIRRNLVTMATELSLEVDDEDIEQLLEVVPEELTNEELLELEQQRVEEEEARGQEKEDEEVSTKTFTAKGLAAMFSELNKVLKMAEEMDPNAERISLVERNVHAAFAAYHQIYEEQKATQYTNNVSHFNKKDKTSQRPGRGTSVRHFKRCR